MREPTPSGGQATAAHPVLEQEGWRLARSKGSHHHFTHPESPNVVSVPVHARDVKRGTLSGILRDADISREEFLRLLK